MVSLIFYTTILFWALHQVNLQSIPFLSYSDVNTPLKSIINISSIEREALEQTTKYDYKLEQLFNNDDLNGIPHKKVIIKAQINGKVFTIDNENSQEWEAINELMNNEIYERQNHVIFTQERITENPSTDIILLTETIIMSG